MSKLQELPRSLPPNIGTVAVQIRCNDHIMHVHCRSIAGILAL